MSQTFETNAASITSSRPRIADVGFGGMLVTFSDVLSDEDNSAALAFRAAVDALRLEGVVETSTSLTSAFVSYDPMTLARTEMRAALDALVDQQDWRAAALPDDRKRWIIPAAFGGERHGPQLKDAADLAGVTPKTAIEQICAAPLRVMTLGFAPGQPYLGSLPENWNIARQTGLTKSVPVGAITVAIRQIVLFSASTPTGWRQVGKCGFHGFRPEAANPFALRPGDEILFKAVSETELDNACQSDLSGAGGAVSERVS